MTRGRPKLSEDSDTIIIKVAIAESDRLALLRESRIMQLSVSALVRLLITRFLNG